MGFISLGEAVARVLDRLEAQREGKTGEVISLPGKAVRVLGEEAPALARGSGDAPGAPSSRDILSRATRRPTAKRHAGRLVKG